MARIPAKLPDLGKILQPLEPERGLRHVFGSLKSAELLFAVALLMTLGWLTDSAYNFLEAFVAAQLPGNAALRQVATWGLLCLPFAGGLAAAGGSRE